jgi:hypothetical protein
MNRKSTYVFWILIFRMFLVHSNNFDRNVDDNTTLNTIVKITTIIAMIRLLWVTILTIIIKLQDFGSCTNVVLSPRVRASSMSYYRLHGIIKYEIEADLQLQNIHNKFYKNLSRSSWNLGRVKRSYGQTWSVLHELILCLTRKQQLTCKWTGKCNNTNIEARCLIRSVGYAIQFISSEPVSMGYTLIPYSYLLLIFEMSPLQVLSSRKFSMPFFPVCMSFMSNHRITTQEDQMTCINKEVLCYLKCPPSPHASSLLVTDIILQNSITLSLSQLWLIE